MHEIHITFKSFEPYYIKKNALFLEKIYLLLNKKFLNIKKKTNKDAVCFESNIGKTVRYPDKKYGKSTNSVNYCSSCFTQQSCVKLTAVNIFGQINLPKKKKLFTVLTGPHIHKKSREQFHFTHSKKKLYMRCQNSKYAFILLFIIKNTEFHGVEIEISFSYNSVFAQIKTTI